MKNITIERKNQRIELVAPYSPDANIEYRKLDGKWDGSIKAWTFVDDEDVFKSLKDILVRFFDYSDCIETAEVKITALEDISKPASSHQIYKGGYLIIEENRRVCKTGDGVMLISGKIGGVPGNWGRVIEEGSVFKIKDFPIDRAVSDEQFKFEIIKENEVDESKTLEKIKELFKSLGKDVELEMINGDIKLKNNENEIVIKG